MAVGQSDLRGYSQLGEHASQKAPLPANWQSRRTFSVLYRGHLTTIGDQGTIKAAIDDQGMVSAADDQKTATAAAEDQRGLSAADPIRMITEAVSMRSSNPRRDREHSEKHARKPRPNSIA
jgi:hypothetical protein